jgi:hypothetical protein
MKNLVPVILLGLSLLTAPPVDAQHDADASDDPNDLLDARPWSLMAYRGWTSTKSLGQTFPQFKYESANEDLYSLELAYTLSPENAVSRFFWHIRARFQLAGNFAIRDEGDRSGDPIYEGDAYFIVRWRNFPWNRYVATSLAIGDGLSYVSRVPDQEEEDNDDTNKLLNYLMLEATLALPSYPQWQLLYRIHHRSGVYGLFGDNSGSNVIGVGLRYHF